MVQSMVLYAGWEQDASRWAVGGMTVGGGMYGQVYAIATSLVLVCVYAMG